MIAIIDYGMGNLGSIKNMFKRIGVISEIVSEPDIALAAEKILLPGVGAFDNAMKMIEEKGFKRVLEIKALEQKVPVLGICLGMQILTNGSEEGVRPGLGWIDATATKIPSTGALKVPHMGWNTVRISNQSDLTLDMNEETKFYFVHSYAVKVANSRNSILKTTYGVEFDSAIREGNIYGAQFHPEKSHKHGMKLLSNFSAL